MARPAAAQIVSVGRSEHPEWTPDEVLGWHTEHDDWWSGPQHHGRSWKDMIVFVRFVPGGEIVGRTRIMDPEPIHPESGPEPGPIWRWHPVEYLDAQPIRGVFLRDFGVSGWRGRPSLSVFHAGARSSRWSLDAASATGV